MDEFLILPTGCLGYNRCMVINRDGNFDWTAEPCSLVERLFPHPDNVSQGEYHAIYDLLLNMDERDNPQALAGVLREFAGWAMYMLKQLKSAGLIGESELAIEL